MSVTSGKAGRSTSMWILGALLSLGVAACSDSASAPGPATALAEDPDYPGIPATSALSSSQGGCVLSTVGGVKTYAIPVAANETVIVSKAGATAPFNLLVNGKVCTAGANGSGAAVPGTVAGTAGAATGTVQQVAVTLAAASSSVIIDFSGGVFLAGTATVKGFLVGGAGNIKVKGTTGNDTIYVGGTATAPLISVNNTRADIGAATGNAGVQTVTISGGAGNDIITGQPNASTGGGTTGFAGVLTLYGAAGNDTLTPGYSTSTLFGGDGNDSLMAAATSTASGAQVAYLGEAGSDTLDFRARSAALTIVMDGALVSGSPTGTWSGASAGAEHLLVGSDIEVLFGGNGGDTVTGHANGLTYTGGSGSDWFIQPATTSTDVFVGGAGVDTIDYSARTNPVRVFLTGAAISGETAEKDNIATDVENVIGGSGDDFIVGSAGDNYLYGGAGNDTIYGMAGDDMINGGPGDDTLFGGDGDDTFVYFWDFKNATSTAADQGGDIVNCGAGATGGTNDTLDFGYSTAAVTATLAWHVTSTLSGVATEHVYVGGGVVSSTWGAVDTADACENLFGGTADGLNVLTGNSLDNVLDGHAVTSTLDGAGGVDTCMNYGSGTATNCEL